MPTPNNGFTVVSRQIKTTFQEDTFPLVEDKDLLGGYLAVQNQAALQSVPLARQKVGMTAITQDTFQTFILKVVGSSPTWAAATPSSVIPANIPYTDLPTGELTTLQTQLDRSNSRWGRASAAELTNLFAAMYGQRMIQNQTQLPITIVGYGSSVGFGATLPVVADAPVNNFASTLAAILDPSGLYNFQVLNYSQNGSVISQQPTAQANMQAALQVSAAAINAGGTGYSLGDVVSVIGGTLDANCPNAAAAQVRVVAVSSGVVTGLSSVIPGTQSSSGPYTVSPGTTGIATTGGTGSGLTLNLTLITPVPVLAYMAYGMNDFQESGWNAGRTLPGYATVLIQLVNKLKLAGQDVVVTTTPHLSVLRNATNGGYAYPNSINQTYPVNITLPVLSSQLSPPYPNGFDAPNQTILTADFLKNGGPQLTVDMRFLRGNQSNRYGAKLCGALLIDIERYWFESLQEQMIASGAVGQPAQALAAETILFNTAQFVHPNLLGHQTSYWRGNADTVWAIAQQSGQSATEPRNQGYFGINIPYPGQPTGTLDLRPPVGDMTNPPLVVQANIGTPDGSGNKAPLSVLKIDPATGDTILSNAGINNGLIRLSPAANANWYGQNANGTFFSQGNYGLLSTQSNSIGTTATVTFPATQAGKLSVVGIAVGVGTPQLYTNIFQTSATTLALGTAAELSAGNIFTVSISGLIMTLTTTRNNVRLGVRLESMS